jgi:uncharacterized protein with HEPN domain
MEADQLGRLQDILAATRLIATYVKDTTADAFRADMQKARRRHSANREHR